MSTDDFFKVAENQFEVALPFVIYRTPYTNTIKGIFQQNDLVYNSEHLEESGFVFSPFNSENNTVLLPLEHSEILTLENPEIASHVTIPNNQKDTFTTEAKTAHINLVSKALEAIKKDTFKKVVLSRKETVSLKETNPIVLFQRLLANYSSAFVYCWYHPKIGLWLGATPETLLSVTGNRFTTMSLAGTQSFTEQPLWKGKETEEQQLVTDFIIDSLQPHVESLSVGNTETLRAGHLLHLRTKISGILKTKLSTLVKALHPTPAVCGLPKEVTKQFILNHENYNREYYTGFLGELNIKEDKKRNPNRRNVENNAYHTIKSLTRLYVNLRCMQLTDSKAHLYVGGGITKDSNPEHEFQETVTKAETMKKVIF